MIFGAAKADAVPLGVPGGPVTDAASSGSTHKPKPKTKMSQQHPPILTIKMVPAGIELVLAALNKLPREQVEGLFSEIAGQYGYQMQELQKAAQAAAATNPPTDTEQALSTPSDPVPATTEESK